MSSDHIHTFLANKRLVLFSSYYLYVGAFVTQYLFAARALSAGKRSASVLVLAGKGGGKADMARGSGKEIAAKDALLAKAAETLG